MQKTRTRTIRKRIRAPRKASGASGHRPRNDQAGLLDELYHKIEKLSEWRRRLSTLLKYGKEAVATTNLDDLLQLLAEEAKTVLTAQRATLFLVDKKQNELWSKVALGTKTIRVPLDKGIAGAVATTGKLLNIRDVYKDARFNADIDKRTGFRTKSLLSIPMFDTKDNVIGVFQVLNKNGMDFFDKQDEELLTILADQASGHIENAQLYQQVRRGAQETIFRLAGAVEFKDKNTHHHLWRMSQYAAAIARQMGFDPEWVENLRLAAPMHDIGKLGVSDAILNKPGKLDDQEWVQMKKHPEFGADILKDSENELIQMSATIAHCHHEKFDGTGYPRGLKGEEIPIEARIASLADVLDALTSKRIYKPSCSMEDSIIFINGESGKHFDPRVVEAFNTCLNEITSIMQMYSPQDEQTEIRTSPVSF